MSHRLSDKAIACLVIAKQPVLTQGWAHAMAGAERHFGKKPIERKFDELARKGYIRPGDVLGPRHGTLTAKGRAALQAENAP